MRAVKAFREAGSTRHRPQIYSEVARMPEANRALHSLAEQRPSVWEIRVTIERRYLTRMQMQFWILAELLGTNERLHIDMEELSGVFLFVVYRGFTARRARRVNHGVSEFVGTPKRPAISVAAVGVP
jgi:hypothetical protein